jgi:GNAT superfamily N-acetyltransferase
MAAVFERYALRPARSPREWAAYHAIRRDAIFAALLPGQPYHCPHVLLHDDEVVGVVRIDLIGKKQAGLRLVAIRGDLQRRGHGRILLRLAEEAAHALGRTEIVINAHPTSLGFYLANGYREGEWSDVRPPPATLIRVGKRLP